MTNGPSATLPSRLWEVYLLHVSTPMMQELRRIDARAAVVKPFGSHLYGTDGPSSDFDFKGVFIPSRESALIGKITTRISKRPNKAEGVKNAAGDVEWEMISLHEFVRLALEGQTMALDMLHASLGRCVLSSREWLTLHSNRRRFCTKNLKAFVGYARRQAAKYGVKGSRLHTAKEIVRFLAVQGDLLVASVVDPLLHSGLEHVHGTDDPAAPVEILGKRMTALAKCSHYLPSFQKFLESYGDRARAAERSEGVDWKAMSHAIRAAWEVRAILTGEGFSLPLPAPFAEHLRTVKEGRLDFQATQTELEERIEEIEALAASSPLPEAPDSGWSDLFLLDAMGGG